jgi:hypothetical protein
METKPYTLVRMSKTTAERLDKRKAHPRQSREEIVIALLDLAEKRKI